MAEPWHDAIAALPHDELVRRLQAALILHYEAQRNHAALTHLDNVLNGRWFAVPQRYGGNEDDRLPAPSFWRKRAG